MMELLRADSHGGLNLVVESQVIIPQVMESQGSLPDSVGDKGVASLPLERQRSDRLKKDTVVSTERS